MIVPMPRVIWLLLVLSVICFCLIVGTEAKKPSKKNDTPSRTGSSVARPSYKPSQSGGGSTTYMKPKPAFDPNVDTTSYSSGKKKHSKSKADKKIKKKKKKSKKMHKKKKHHVKLQKSKFKLTKMVPYSRRLTSMERRIIWAVGAWRATRALSKVGRYLHYHCRSRVQTCRDDYTEKNASTKEYCGFIKKDEDCLRRHSGRHGCSHREVMWIKTAACTPDVTNSSIVAWENSTKWFANTPLKLSVSVSSEECQEVFEQCRQESYSTGHAGSYCAMVHDNEDCLLRNGSCKTHYNDMKDAACQRTQLNFEDRNWLVSDELRLTVAITPTKCQMKMVACIDPDEHRSYCHFVRDKSSCLMDHGGSCSRSSYDSIREVACIDNGAHQNGGIGLVRIILLLGMFVVCV